LFKKHAFYDCFKKIGDKLATRELGKIHFAFDMKKFREDITSINKENTTVVVFQEMWKNHKKR